MTEESYSPKDIRYSKPQMLWLIKNIKALRQGEWPESQFVSGYIDLIDPIAYVKGKVRAKRISRHFSRRAGFEITCGIVADLDIRMNRCIRDVLMLEAHFGWDKTIGELSRHFQITEQQVTKGIYSALAYISGKWPKRFEDGTLKSYQQFVGHRR